jgi:molybdopterin synthase sulfur carrier subunit
MRMTYVPTRIQSSEFRVPHSEFESPGGHDFANNACIPLRPMATVFIPAQLRSLTGGADRVEAAGESVREVVASLDAAHPGIAARLQQGDSLAPGLAVSIDGAFTNRGLAAKVGPASEIHFLPAIGGG